MMMMVRFKYILRFAALLALASFTLTGFKTVDYTITANIAAKDSTLFYLTYDYAGKQIIKATVLKDNQAIFNGHLPEAVVCTLSNSANQQIKIFVAENRAIKLEGNVDKLFALKVENAPQDSLYNEFKLKSGAISGKYRVDVKQSGADLHDKMSKPYLIYQQRLDSLTTTFVKENSSTAAAALGIIETYLNNPDRAKAEVCFKLLSPVGQKSVYAKRVLQFVEAAEAIAPGHQAPGFTLSDVNGRPVSLSDFKGKYVFLDFWASWCAPCRKTHPLLRELHEQYAVNSNLVFVGISMDASITSWKQAIETDKLSWLQLNDPKSLNGSVADEYGVKSIPFNCIIDPQGGIMATNLHDEALIAFLKNLNNKLK